MLLLSVTLCVLAADAPDPDAVARRERLAPVRASIEAWEQRISSRELHYTLETLYMPTEKWEVSDPVRTTNQVHDLRAGGKFKHSYTGDSVNDSGRRILSDRERAFDGSEAASRIRDRTFRLANPDRATRHLPSPHLNGLSHLMALLRSDSSQGYLLQLEVQETGQDRIELTFVISGDERGEESRGWARFVICKLRPYLIFEYEHHLERPKAGPERRLMDVSYHEFQGGIWYPVSGSMAYFDPATGEAWREITFLVDVERTVFDLPPAAIQDAEFRIQQAVKP